MADDSMLPEDRMNAALMTLLASDDGECVRDRFCLTEQGVERAIRWWDTLTDEEKVLSMLLHRSMGEELELTGGWNEQLP